MIEHVEQIAGASFGAVEIEEAGDWDVRHLPDSFKLEGHYTLAEAVELAKKFPGYTIPEAPTFEERFAQRGGQE